MVIRVIHGLARFTRAGHPLLLEAHSTRYLKVVPTVIEAVSLKWSLTLKDKLPCVYA